MHHVGARGAMDNGAGVGEMGRPVGLGVDIGDLDLFWGVGEVFLGPDGFLDFLAVVAERLGKG